LIGFAGALRRSELIGLDVAQVRPTAAGLRLAVRQILVRRAAAAGIKGTRLEPVTPHGMRAGFVTTAYRNGVSDEEIMATQGTTASPRC
jgi:integrase